MRGARVRPVTRVIRVDSEGRVVHGPDPGARAGPGTDPAPMSLADILPQSASADLVSAIRAAAETGKAQFLEFDLLSPEGVRRIHAEATSDPEHRGEFVVIAREYTSTESLDVEGAAARFAESAAATGDVEQVFQDLASVLGGLIAYERLAIVTADKERGEQHVAFSTDPRQERVIPLAGTALEVVSRTDQPIVVPAAIPSVIVVPLRWSGETVAYLSVHSRAWESFGEHDLRVVASMGPPMAAALAAHRSRERAERDSSEREATAAIGAVAATAGDLSTILEVAADRIYRLNRFAGVRVEAAVASSYRDGGPEIVAVRGDEPRGGDGTPDGLVWTVGPATGPLGAVLIRPSAPGAVDELDRSFLAGCVQKLGEGVARIAAGAEIERLRGEIECVNAVDRLTVGISNVEAVIGAVADEIMRRADPVSLKVRVLRTAHAGAPVEASRRASAVEHLLPGGAERETAVPLRGPFGEIGAISACWRTTAAARNGERMLELIAPRLADRLHSALLVERQSAASRDARCLEEIEAAIRECGDPALALNEAAGVLSDRFGGARVAVAVLESNGESISELTTGGFPVPGWATGAARLVEGTLEGAAMLSSGPVSASRSTADDLVARWPAEAPAIGAGTRALAAVVLPASAGVSACLTVRSVDSEGLSQDDIGLLGKAAALVTGPAIRGAAVRGAADPGAEWAAFARIGQIAQSPGSAGLPYARIAAELAGLVGFDQVEVVTRERGGDTGAREYLGGTAVPGWEPGSEFPLSGTVTDAVIRSRSGLFIANEPAAGLARRYPGQAAALAAGLRSLAAAPLLIDNEPAGSLIVRSTRPDAYGQAELTMLEAVAAHLAAAIARRRLQEKIDRQQRERDAVASIGFASAWNVEPELIAERAAATFRRLVECDGVVVTAVSPDADMARVVYAAGVEDADRRFFARRVDRLEGRPEPDDGGRYASSIRAVIGPASRPLGHMQAFAHRPDAFDDADAGLLQELADHIGEAFEHGRAADRSSRLTAEQVLRRRLDRQVQEMKDAAASRDRFFRTAVHELRTPLTSVQAFTEVLMQTLGPRLEAPQLAQLEQIAGSGEQMQELIANLLDLSQIESDTFELCCEEFDAAGLLDHICDGFGALLAARRQRIELDSPGAGLWLYADRARLSAVISNLVSNACKYSDDGAVVRVGAHRDGTRLVVAVADHGVGISTADRDRLFTPFFRGTNPSVLKQPGSGLGLPIARSIVRLHGGELTLESAPGEGTTARFYIEGARDGPSEAYLARAAAERRDAGPDQHAGHG